MFQNCFLLAKSPLAHLAQQRDSDSYSTLAYIFRRDVKGVLISGKRRGADVRSKEANHERNDEKETQNLWRSAGEGWHISSYPGIVNEIVVYGYHLLISVFLRNSL